MRKEKIEIEKYWIDEKYFYIVKKNEKIYDTWIGNEEYGLITYVQGFINETKENVLKMLKEDAEEEIAWWEEQNSRLEFMNQAANNAENGKSWWDEQINNK